MFNIEEELQNLPAKPGVYIMKNSDDEIIYVGKAISLKNRVRQYFQKSNSQGTKVRAMVSHIKEFEYIIVDNEVEALILESNLIKKHKPKYNILLRDDKQYPYIKVCLNEKFPRVMKTRRVLKDGAKYFGPYPSATAVNDAIDILHDIYPIRTCKVNLDKTKKNLRPCLRYHIGKCTGVCIGLGDEEEYREIIKKVLNFLSGKDETIINMIENNMIEASKNLEFEKASVYRDQLNSLLVLQEKQKIVSDTTIDQDIIAMARGLEEVCIQIFFIRGGKILGREHFLIEDNFSADRGEILSSFIKQFYIGAAYVPKEIILETEIEDLEAVSKWLEGKRGTKVNITVPKRGDKTNLIEMVSKNARDMLNKYGDKFLKKHRENIKALEQIQDILGLEDAIKRVEAYDISNISGVHSVGSMVVFENGEAKRSDYRRFKIKTIETPNDYGSMEEVLKRRFTRGLKEQESEEDLKMKGFSSFPDLIMMDGGKGQVNIALRVLENLGLDIPVCGLVKDDFHTTRGIIYNNKEYNMDLDSQGFKLIYKIQEEAHRFAINYHRSLRSKDMFKSELDDIKSIGHKRKVALLKHFKSIEKIKSASVEELKVVETMNIKSATELYNHFRKER
ncbi:excinuclease ABC subunit UvrC [Tissierella creatinophila]|uniref:UvrABC system protein C n=1 Tax=Tissierella creatinophila DSM 6911 TaxID=1123403 RepID=A0A1U7M7V9_TISCR|nr:excinuclease ABC subunit UvrC [Tissierella creatinophila]OLS03288.1 UvrABC system protein C [Tissierella creatinophila DSM 6911]